MLKKDNFFKSYFINLRKYNKNLKKTKKIFNSFLVDLKNNIDLLDPRWIALGERTKGGHPRHPSRVSYKKSFNAFNLDRYINKLKGST